MIPNSPIWAYVNATPLVYVDYGIAIPKYRPNIFGLSIGPKTLGDSNNKVNERYWLVEQDGVNGDVFISGSVGDNWGDKVFLFNEPKKISKIALTFDQLGRAMVFCQVGNNLYLFWYDPTLEAQTLALISTGTSLEAGFDIINNTSDPDSDAMIFYTRGNIIYMRIQRDRWQTEYPESIFLGDGVTPVTGLELVSSGMRVDNRFQVVYRYKDTGYKPPEVVRLSVVVLPSLQGVVAEGSMLTCNVGTYLGGPISYTYKWTRNDVDIVSPTEGAIACTLEPSGETIYRLELSVSDGVDTLVYMFEKSSATAAAGESAIIDYSTGQVILYSLEEVSPEYSSALAAYTTWATELGVSTTESMASSIIGEDDDHGTITANFTPSATGTSTKIGISTEGGLHLYQHGTGAGTSGNSPESTGLITPARYYRSELAPSVVLFNKSVEEDCRLLDISRWQQTGDTLIFYGRWGHYSTGDSAVDAAYRFKRGELTWVSENISGSGNEYIQLFVFDETDTDTSAPDPTGTTRFRKLELGEIVQFSIGSGTIPIDDSTPVAQGEPNYAYYRYRTNDGVSQYSFEHSLLQNNWDELVSIEFQITAVDTEQDEIILVAQANNEATGEFGSQLLIKAVGAEKREFVCIIGGTEVSVEANTKLQAGVWTFRIVPTSANPEGSHAISIWRSWGDGNATVGLSYFTPGPALSSAYALMFGNTNTPTPNKGFKGVMHGFKVSVGGTIQNPAYTYSMPANDKKTVEGYNGIPVYDKNGDYLYLGRIRPASKYNSNNWLPYAYNYVYQDIVATPVYDN